MVLLDVNVLLYAFRNASPHHPQAKRWLEALVSSGKPFGASELVMAGVIRIATFPGASPTRTSFETALGWCDQLRVQPNHRILRPGPTHFRLYTELCREHQLTGKDTADAYHAALAIEHHCAFASYDRGFARFPRLDWIHPGDEAAAG